jgi:hypothetical protein
MADLTDPAIAAAAAAATDSDRDRALGGEGENKFQRAISAWRSTTVRWRLEAPTDFLQILI